MPSWLTHWFERHQHPASLILHLIGIPLTLLAVGVAMAQLVQWRWDLWYRPTVLLIAGYALQWIGHRIEGNDMGELILIKRWQGQPYVAVAPRDADAPDPTTASHPNNDKEVSA